MDLQQAAAQLIGLTAEVEGLAAERHLVEWMPMIVRALQAGVEPADASNHAAADSWRTVYLTLRSIEKISQIVTALLDVNHVDTFSTPELWKAVATLLVHPHAWVKLLSSRLLGALFARIWKLAEKAPLAKDNRLEAVIALQVRVWPLLTTASFS